MCNDPWIDTFPIHLSAKRATSKREPEFGRGRTAAFLDVVAGCSIVGVARVALHRGGGLEYRGIANASFLL